MPSTDDRIMYYEDKSGEFRWKRKAANGEVISSGEGYATKSGAKRGALRANPDLDPTIPISDEDRQTAARNLQHQLDLDRKDGIVRQGKKE